jgi:acyl-CoA synthetase (AMP-forming)/AMP-acid ligase II
MIDTSGWRTLADGLSTQAKARPNDVAMVFEDRETTFADLERRSAQVAAGLRAAGVRADDRVAILTKNSDRYYEVLFGCAKAGAALVGVNWRLAAPEMVFIIKNAEAQVLFVGRDFADLVASIQSQVERPLLVIALDDEDPRFPGYTDWRDGCAPAPADPSLGPSHDIIQLYTSGTTGLPKGVMLTNANYLAFFGFASQLEWSSYEPGDPVMLAMPQFHVAGVNVGILAIIQGAKAVIVKEVDPQRILAMLQDHKIRHAFFVPAVILLLLQTPGCDTADFSHLRQIFYGASPIAEELLKRAQTRFGARFTQLYGLTETVGAGTYLDHASHDPLRGKLRACGVPWPGVEVVCVRPDGSRCAVGEVGEVAIRSDVVMKGYWRNPEATMAAIRDGWFHTGDAAFFDAEGYLFIHDRVKDMIVSGGENIYPAEVENAIFGHPDVADVAVIGVPDEKWGEAVKAIVVAKPGASPDPAEIIAYARARIAGYKVPKSVDFTHALPRNPSGKILRRELREPYWRGHVRRVS